MGTTHHDGGLGSLALARAMLVKFSRSRRIMSAVACCRGCNYRSVFRSLMLAVMDLHLCSSDQGPRTRMPLSHGESPAQSPKIRSISKSAFSRIKAISSFRISHQYGLLVSLISTAKRGIYFPPKYRSSQDESNG